MQVSGAVSPQLHYFEFLAASKLLPWQGQLLSRTAGETEFVTTILETVLVHIHLGSLLYDLLDTLLCLLAVLWELCSCPNSHVDPS